MARDYFNYFPNSEPFQMSKSTLNLAVGTGETAYGYTDKGCLLKYAFQKHVARYGNRKAESEKERFAEITEQAALRRSLAGMYSWTGNLGHSYVEDSLHAIVDREKGESDVISQEELSQEYKSRLESEFEQSRRYHPQSYLDAVKDAKRAMREARYEEGRSPIWLYEHAKPFLGAGRAISRLDNDKLHQKSRDELNVNIDFIGEHISKLVNDSPYDKWAIVEGKELENGEIKRDEGISREQARATRVNPYFDIMVDDPNSDAVVQVRMFCSIDIAVWVGDKFVISDLKTGKEKSSHFTESELYAWFSLEGTDLVDDPEKITLQMIYPKSDGNHFPTQDFSLDALTRIQHDTKERVQEILKHFVPLNSRELDIDIDDPKKNSLARLTRIYPHHHAACIYTLGYFARHKNFPKLLPQLSEELSPRQLPPKPEEIINFVAHNFSPIELARGLYSDPVKAQQVADAAYESESGKELRFGTYHESNLKILLDRFPNSGSTKQQAMDFMNSFTVDHIRLTFGDKFPATGAQHTPRWCRNCEFVSLCPPGKKEANLK